MGCASDYRWELITGPLIRRLCAAVSSRAPCKAGRQTGSRTSSDGLCSRRSDPMPALSPRAAAVIRPSRFARNTVRSSPLADSLSVAPPR
ncbi:hypothetical protein AAFF_G00196550 [Aldrovandia affinis]|uniref:Uncharacterized protein n=1 Tax=Aldrovandia affinis TaxID=143900 RepID=A0AAD7W6T5_9TELE|nr:hypothetical protein AAFF_G00196550 [Aldrovandia affinis]